MATYKVRGIAHNIIYPYRTEDGKVKHQWETYSTELEAMHRKAYIDYLQKRGKYTVCAIDAPANSNNPENRSDYEKKYRPRPSTTICGT